MDEITLQDLNIEPVVLDPRNEVELLQQAKDWAYYQSNGQLNDFSVHGVLDTLIRGQAFAGSELLYYINKLPLALVVKFLEVTGTQQIVGAKAKATITFTLTAIRGSDTYIASGTEIIDRTGNYSFYTDSELVIKAGFLSGEVTATAKAEGESYNRAAGSLTRLVQPLSYVKSVNNYAAATGGRSTEALDLTVARQFKQLRRTSLVTAPDYEEEAEQILGNGSRAKALPLRGPNGEKEQKGAVHIYCLSPDGTEASPAELSLVYGTMAKKIQLGTLLFVDSIDFVNLNFQAIVKLLPGQDPLQTAQDIEQALKDYLSPQTYEIGAGVLLNEIEYVVRGVPGIKYVEEVLMFDEDNIGDGSGRMDIGMPDDYYLPRYNSLTLTLVDSNNQTYSYVLPPSISGWV